MPSEDMASADADVSTPAMDESAMAALEEEARADLPISAEGLRLARLAGVHALVLLVALSLFAAADAWSVVTGLGIAAVLSIVTGALAGIVTANLVHEWFHYAGARYVGASFAIPERLGLFVYDWHFERNSPQQFLTMSVAGNIGGLVAALVLWNSVPSDNIGRAALLGAVVASIVFAACVEWPVIRAVRSGSEPFTELAKIPGRLKRSFVIASLAGVFATLALAP